MGIIWLPKQKYVCSKCGSDNCHEFTRTTTEELGEYKGVVCNDCGHMIEHYEPSALEQETQNTVYYTYNPYKAKAF